MYIGGVPALGYRSEDGKLVLDPPRDEAVRLMFNTYAETGSVRLAHQAVVKTGATSSRGGPVAEPTVWNALHKRIYTGKIAYQGKVYPGQHPAIIAEELFEYVQKLLAQKMRDPGTRVPSLPFCGIIRCQECGSGMTAYYTDKPARRYHYYRCSNLGRRGWASCSIKQISADRFHDGFYNNLLRISMDTDYLKNLIFAQESGFRNPVSVGLQPDRKTGVMTPENLGNQIKEFLQICARRTGMERYLSIRRHLSGISYSKKTISVVFKYVRPLDATTPDFARPPDGNCTSEKLSASASQSSARGFCPPARTSKSDLPLLSRKTKKPGPFGGPDLIVGLESNEMVLGTGLEPVTPSMSRRYSNQLS